MQVGTIPSTVCRSLLGLLFIASAVLKFISVDSFEIYIYSWDVMPLWLASWFSRAVLFVEMALGLMLLSGIFRKLTDRLVLLVLVGFSIFLLGLIVAGEDGNCHCMGEAFEFSPTQSLLKNLLLIGLLWGSFHSTEPACWKRWNVKGKLLLLLLIASAVFSIAKLPYGLASKKVTVYNEEKFREWVEKEDLVETLRQNQHELSIIAFFSTSCRHCQMAMSKLEVCLKKTQLDRCTIPIRWVVWGSEESLEAFMKKYEIDEQTHTFLDPKEMMPITEYNIPLILFLEKDSVLSSMSNASFDESKVLEFLEMEKIKL